MTRGSDRRTKAVATLITILAAVFSANAGIEHATADPAPTRVTNSLTTQFPLGGQKLSTTTTTRREATPPARHPPAASQTTSATSTASAPPPRATTTTRPPLLGQRGGSAAAPLIMVGVVIVGGLAVAQICRISVRRRRRARRTDRAVAATPVAEPAAHGPDAATAVAPPAAHRPDAAPPRSAPIERTRARSRAPHDPRPAGPPAIAEAPRSDAADEDVVANPLAQLEREILEHGAASSAPAASRRSLRGDGAYRLGQILYDRGRLDEAAAAWRLAASKRHAGAAARLAELLEQSGDTEGARAARRDARRLGDPDATEPGRRRP